MKTFKTKLLVSAVATSLLMIAAPKQDANAHTRLTVSSAMESSARHGRTSTEVNIPHGCGDNAVIGNVLFLPDAGALMQKSTDDFETFEAQEGDMLDFLTKPPTMRLVVSNHLFTMSALIMDGEGTNPIGFWAAGGGSIPASNHIGRLPMTISAMGIQPESCATKVRIVPAIANICNVTGMDGIDSSDATNPNVDFWTAPDAGSKFDAPGWNFPARYDLMRDLENNPLPESCGEGFAVRIYPSAEQVNRDMPVSIDGTQVWPAP